MKNQKGITLIALIITILVMLILAAVTISLVVSEDGVLSKTQSAESKMSLAEVEEKAELIAADLKTDIETKNFTGNVMEEYLNRLKEQFGEDCQIVENTIIIGNGKYKIIVKNDDLDREVIDTTGDTNNTQIDYEEIGQILTNIFVENITEGEGINQLKEKGAIEDMTDMFSMQNENGEMYCYFYKIDALYKMNMNDSGISFSFVENDDNLEEYTFFENMTLAKKELEKIFIGMDVLEVLEKFNKNELISFILEHCQKITAIDKIEGWSGNLRIANITVVNENKEITFGLDASGHTICIIGENGIINKIEISYGS